LAGYKRLYAELGVLKTVRPRRTALPECGDR
jgi:hypothetical protein